MKIIQRLKDLKRLCVNEQCAIKGGIDKLLRAIRKERSTYRKEVVYGDPESKQLYLTRLSRSRMKRYKREFPSRRSNG